MYYACTLAWKIVLDTKYLVEENYACMLWRYAGTVLKWGSSTNFFQGSTLAFIFILLLVKQT